MTTWRGEEVRSSLTHTSNLADATHPGADHRSGPPEPQARKAGRAPAFYLRKALLLTSPTGDGRREMRRMLVAGNWKLNGSTASLAELDNHAVSAEGRPERRSVVKGQGVTIRGYLGGSRTD